MILVLHAAATLFMTGLIWFVQWVHYPLFASVGKAVFADYEALHTMRTTMVVAPVMLAELLTAGGLLLFSPRISEVPPVELGISLALLAGIWISTAAVQVPAHAVLSQGFQAEAYQRLVTTNWWRTAAWTARSALVCLWLYRTLRLAT